MINLLTGNMKSACKYLLDLVHYSKGDVKVEAQELSEQIRMGNGMRAYHGTTSLPIQPAIYKRIAVKNVDYQGI
ncbi:MAG: hypothetical protein Q7V05_12995 [Methanoregula sp.]|nr:hypothetical protein [Methanoregula sp.]